MLIIVIIIVTAIALALSGKAFKYAIDSTVKRTTQQIKAARVDNPALTRKLRNNIKKTFEYSFRKTNLKLVQIKTSTEKSGRIPKRL